MIQRDGWWFPDGDLIFHKFHPQEAARDLPWFISNVPGRGTIVQAGANIGTYPLALADHFRRVITFEPDEQSWECLMANLRARDCHGRIDARNAALGTCGALGGMVDAQPGNWGARRFEPDPGGSVAQVSIDSLKLDACDAIWLDIEGAELAALHGAGWTIKRFHPVIAVEENGNGLKYGVEQYDIQDHLEVLGYELTGGCGCDQMYVWRAK